MILYLGNALSKHGKSISVIETLVPKLSIRYDVIYGSEKKNIFLRFIDMFMLLMNYRKKTDVVIIDTYSTLSFYYVVMIAFICRVFKIPYIPIIHGGNFKHRLSKSPLITSSVFKHSYINVSPSLYLLKVFSDAGYNTVYIPNSVVLDDIEFTNRKTVSPKLLWVRSFNEIYNPAMAVRVLKELSLRYPASELCMVGSGSETIIQEVKVLMKELGIEQNIMMTGKLPQKDWYELAKKYDIFINTTNIDNHPVSIVEAMALGFPIVSTNAGGLPFLIDSGVDGLLVECNDVTAMSNQIISLIEDPEKTREISTKAREKAMTFDWKLVENSWFDLLDTFSPSKKSVYI